MAVRPALPNELPAVARMLATFGVTDECVVGAVMPAPIATGGMSALRLLPGMLGLRSRVRVFVEEQRGRHRAVALVYAGRRPEWVLLMLAAQPGPDGADAAFRLLSGVSAVAARSGMQRVFAATPDRTRARETFFQAGFYSYTRETWYGSSGATLAEPTRHEAHAARGRDAHDLFRFYLSTTPHAVQRAEQLSVEDFDVGRRAGAFDPPHIGGNPLEMRRQMLAVMGDGSRTRGYAVSYRGSERHPHVCKVRTVAGETDLARELLRVAALDLPHAHAVLVPVRSYEDHVARALVAEGFGEAATSMLFVKELAVRIEEPALAPAVVR